MAVAIPVASRAQAGKFLSFALGGEVYGLEILKVQEISNVAGITPLPRAPEFLRGVIDLRGRTIPVVSLRRKLGLAAVADTDTTCVVVVQVPHRERDILLGVVVDKVAEVLNFESDQIDEQPACGGGMEETDYIIGLGRHADGTVVLLDIDGVLDGDDIERILLATGQMAGRVESYR